MNEKREWPAGVKTITLEQLDQLGVDDNQQLYWKGRPVEVRHPLSLTPLQNFWAFVVAASTILAAAGSIAQGWAAYHEWACRVQWPAAVCAGEAISPK